MSAALTTARARILAELQRAGAAGCTTWQLIDATHHSRAAGRVWELAQEWDIDKRMEGPQARWILRGRKAQPVQVPLFG